MGVVKQIDVPLLFQLWVDESLRREEIAHRLGCSHAHLARAVKAHGLPARARRTRVVVPVDPTPDEIERLKAELKARHMAERRAEPDELTNTKVSQWRRGVCCPGGARHA